MIKILKNKNIEKEKKGINLCPNHYHYISASGRFWDTDKNGQAFKDKKGWYKNK